MLESGEGFVDVPRHGEVDFLSNVVPFDGKSAVLPPLPVAGAFVVSPYRVDQMLCVLFAHILYPEVINNEGETDGMHVVFPQTWVHLALAIAMFLQAFLEKLLGDDAGLW